MRLLYHRILVLLYFILDLSLTVLSFGFYNGGWNFDFHKIGSTFDITSYHYWTNPLDFAFIAVVRQLVVVTSIVLVRHGKAKMLKSAILAVDGIAVSCYIVSVVKLLSFDETPGFLQNVGVFMNLGVSVLNSLFLCFVVRYSLLVDQFAYQTLVNEPERQESNGTTAENGETNNAGLENGTTTVTFDRNRTDSTEEDSSEKEEDDDGVSKEEIEKRLPIMTHIWQIIKLCSKQWKWFLLSYTLLLADCILNLIEPALYSQMMTSAITMKSFETLKHTCFLLAAVQLVESTVSTLKYACMSYAERTTARQIRSNLFKSILHQDISFFDENKTGQLMSRITHDSDSISSSLPRYIETSTTNLINFCGSLPIMCYYSWQLSLTAFITFPISLILTKVYALYVEKLAEKENDANATSNETVEEVLSAIRTVRSFATEKIEWMRYKTDTDNWFKISMKSVIASTAFSYFWSLMWNAEDVMVFLYGGYLTLNGRMKPENMMSYVFYLWRLHSALHSFTSLFSDLMKTIGSSRKVIYLMNRQPELDYEHGTEKPEITGSIIFEDVVFAYPTRKTVDVLQGLRLTIEPGKTIALVGPSGNGKTTIVSLVEQFYAPRTGNIYLDGTELRNIDHEYYHSKVALVAQEPTLFSGSIKDNILYGIENGTEEEMLRVSKMANVHEFVEKLEKKYNTKCGEKGVQMSGGQKQRIAIARALIRNPAVLILDEATSALDAESEALVQEALNRCAKDRTVIVIAHRLSTVRRADRIAVIEKGNVTEIGSHEELMKNSEGMYHKLVSRQLEPKVTEPIPEVF